jgi:hypothetical protein
MDEPNVIDPPTLNSDTPDHCVLSHSVFRELGEPTFCRTESDAVPAMRLDFVAGLRLGDRLPAEVLTGAASWSPSALHAQIAAAKLRLQLVSWLTEGGPDGETATDPEVLLALVEDPGFRPKVQAAFTRAATALGVPDSEAVVRLVGELAHELAYIEALRERLLTRVDELVRRLDSMGRRWRGDWTHAQTLTQVRRLATTGLRQLAERFGQMDAQTGEVVSALRNTHGQRAFIRNNRDWLYRTFRAWEPILLAWDSADGLGDREMWALIERTYQFLAPRFMPVTEWISAARPQREDRARMVW